LRRCTVSFRRRAAASLVDLGLGAVLAALLASTTGQFFARRAVVAFHIGEPDSSWTGVVPMVLGVVSPLSYGFAFGWLVVLLADAVAGATPGKLFTGLAVVPVGGALSPRRARWIRTVVKTAPLWTFSLALVVGSGNGVRFSMGLSVATAVGLVVSVGRGRPAVHDGIAGTRVAGHEVIRKSG